VLAIANQIHPVVRKEPECCEQRYRAVVRMHSQRQWLVLEVTKSVVIQLVVPISEEQPDRFAWGLGQHNGVQPFDVAVGAAPQYNLLPVCLPEVTNE
jgi:hypothetical protein